jgi:hypothetical protein
MARHSTAYSINAELRDELLAKWRSGQFTLDQLAQLVKGKVSRSALQRYLHRADVRDQEQKRLQDATNRWCAELGEEPGGDIGRRCHEMLRMLAHAQLRRLNGEDGQEAEPRDVATLARALKDLELAVSIGLTAGSQAARREECGERSAGGKGAQPGD